MQCLGDMVEILTWRERAGEVFLGNFDTFKKKANLKRK